MLLIQTQEDLGIAFGLEANATGGEIGADALKVVELAVVSHQNLAVIGEKRLASAVLVEIDDRQTGMAEANTGVIEGFHPESIRSPVDLDRCHVHQQLRIDPLIWLCAENASDSTHGSFLRSRPSPCRLCPPCR